jgi:hypothetical protein
MELVLGDHKSITAGILIKLGIEGAILRMK